jgi:hypothetical protein
VVKYPFERDQLPENGIYFVYEIGEIWGHGGHNPRIVRVGTHREGNFRKRIAEHFLLDAAKMNFDSTKSPPHDRSIFRKHIGRALLNRAGDPYISIFDLDFMKSRIREEHGHLRDIDKERQIEAEVTRILREQFSFRFVVFVGQSERMGSKGLEAPLIGTLAHCRECRPSKNWLGQYSPIAQVRQSGLWLVQHLRSEPLSDTDKQRISVAVQDTNEWLRSRDRTA